MTDTRKDLIEALTLIQNHPAHNHHDILTIHFCAPVSSDAELRASIEANMSQIERYSNEYRTPRRRAA